MRAPPELVLFDFDGVLAHYSHELRIAQLAKTTGCLAQRVGDVLFDSGLETQYDSGLIDTAQYLEQLGGGLGCVVDETSWIASRIAGNRVETTVVAMVCEVARRTRIGVLTNNGALMAEAMRDILPALFPALEGNILCSGALGVRKPDVGIFQRAVTHFAVAPHQVLFVDDVLRNVEGARRAGLRAAHVPNEETLAAVLRAHHLI